MPDRFIFAAPHTRIVFGNGTRDQVPAEARRANMSRVLILCSKGRTQLAGAMAASLGETCVGISDAALPNMPREAFDAVQAQLASLQADGFIVIGGGSPIGLAKAVAVASQLPFIAIVTTLSGSEMSSKWALGRGLGRAGGNDVRALPAVAIYDPELTLELPGHVIAASGMNAMAHAVESLYGPDTNPVVQTLSLDAISRLAKSLPEIVANPRSVDARNEALYAAWLAATFRSAVGLHHVIAQQVRQLFDLDHAKTHAAVLPYALAFNTPAIAQATGRLNGALGTDDAARWLFDLNVRLGLPTGLAALGMPKERLDEAADVVMQVKCDNPRPFTRADVMSILQQALAGQRP
jgi:maleylacetate reductase